MKGRTFCVSSLLLLLVACAQGQSLSPLASSSDAGTDGAAGESGAAGVAGAAGGEAGTGGQDAGPVDPTLGPPCGSDMECDDGVMCTTDLCDPGLGRCRFTPDDSQCPFRNACDGAQVCDLKHGCQPGTPMTCADGDACTIDSCDPTGPSCVHNARDADGDGDPDSHCQGHDCDDTNPRVSSLAPEICGNGVDDNCDGQVDEDGCTQPANDDCADPLVLDHEGSYVMSLSGAKLDTSATCATSMSPKLRDVIAALVVPPGAPRRLDMKVTWPSGSDAVALGTQCGDSTTELSCAKSGPNYSNGGQIARMRVHSLAPGTYPLAVYADQDISATVSFQLSDADAAPTNETCGTAAEITPGVPVIVPVVGAVADIPTKCGSPNPDLVYSLTLTEPQDVRVFASTTDGLGDALVSIRDADCAEAANEISCSQGDPLSSFTRSLGPGKIFIAVQSTAGSDIELLVTLAPPTKPPPDESCTTGSPVLVANQSRPVDLTDHTDDLTICTTGMVDAAYALPLVERSDVLLVLRGSQGVPTALALGHPPCAAADIVACKGNLPSPLRLSRHDLDPGAYRVIVEMSAPAPGVLTPFVRKTAAPVVVLGADSCDEAFVLPPEGGSFQGNTANASAQYPSGCDQGGTGPFGAPEQMLRLTLSEKKRVVLDMSGSSYATLLDVRKATSCPGEEIDLACTIGTLPDRSFLDLTLDPGDYNLQIDGFNGASGAWMLDVYVVDP
jgi:hypothetical protein